MRVFGAAAAIRQRMGVVRFKLWDVSYEASVAAVRKAMGDKDFESAWAEGAALSTEEAIAYAQRGRGQRKRPTSGWASLTPAERDVVRRVSEGLGNNDIATRLFVSPRTVQSHLTPPATVARRRPPTLRGWWPRSTAQIAPSCTGGWPPRSSPASRNRPTSMLP